MCSFVSFCVAFLIFFCFLYHHQPVDREYIDVFTVRCPAPGLSFFDFIHSNEVRWS